MQVWTKVDQHNRRRYLQPLQRRARGADAGVAAKYLSYWEELSRIRTRRRRCCARWSRRRRRYRVVHPEPNKTTVLFSPRSSPGTGVVRGEDGRSGSRRLSHSGLRDQRSLSSKCSRRTRTTLRYVLLGEGG